MPTIVETILRFPLTRFPTCETLTLLANPPRIQRKSAEDEMTNERKAIIDAMLRSDVSNQFDSEYISPERQHEIDVCQAPAVEGSWDYTKCRCENNGDYCDYCQEFHSA